MVGALRTALDHAAADLRASFTSLLPTARAASVTVEEFARAASNAHRGAPVRFAGIPDPRTTALGRFVYAEVRALVMNTPLPDDAWAENTLKHQ